MLKLLKNMRRKEVLMVLLCTVLVAVQVYFYLRLPDYMTDLTTLIKTSGATADILSVGVKMLGCTLASAVLAVGCGYLAAKAASGFSFTVREKLFSHVMDIGSEEMQDFSVASLITRTTNDITQIQMIVAMGLQMMIKSPIMAVWAVIKILGKSWTLSAITAGFVLALLAMMVVIIGIVVTFAGSGLIERWRVAREVRATMLLVHAELETNRADFMQVWDYQQWEMRACKFLTDNRRDLKRIPSDTLASFDPVYGRIHFFHPRRDAFEVLKNSGLMSSVPDKDFLLAVTQGYAVLADLEENISMYYQLKLTAQNDMSKDFSEKQRERFYTGDMYERWECIFSVPCFAEFMLTAPYYFPEGYIEGLLADVDRSIRAIEAKYKLDKKPTDD